MLTKFQPIRSSGCAVSPSWTLSGSAQPPGAGVVAVGVLDHRGEDVAGVDHAVAVDVGDLARPDVGRVVEVAPADVAVVEDVDQVLHPAGGDLGLVDPDVLIQVGVVVVDPGVDVGDGDGGRRPGGDVPRLRRVDAERAVEAVEEAPGRMRLVRGEREVLDLVGLDRLHPGGGRAPPRPPPGSAADPTTLIRPDGADACAGAPLAAAIWSTTAARRRA